MRQILVNIIGNAVKFTENGSVQVTTSLGETPSGSFEASFEVRDTGVGIPFAVQSHMFDSFSQGDDSTTRRYGGTGLGLAICRQLCELMQGSIYFTSVPGEGSTFHFTARLRAAEVYTEELIAPPTFTPPVGSPAASHHPADVLQTVIEAAPAESRARILVAEDAPVNREILRYFLENLGVRVDLAEDGREALDAFSRVAYDLIIMDCQMPEIDGYEATRIIRERERNGASLTPGADSRGIDSGSQPNCQPEIPIIALTANAFEGDREKCLAAGMSDYVAKPIELQDVTAVLERWLPPSLLPHLSKDASAPSS